MTKQTRKNEKKEENKENKQKGALGLEPMPLPMQSAHSTNQPTSFSIHDFNASIKR